MKIIISERQYKVVSEQPITLAPPGGYDYQKPDVIRKSFEQTGISPHTYLEISAIASGFIPFIGPAFSMGFGLADAKLYWDEGDKKTASLVGVFSMIPIVGGLATKLGLVQWTAKALGEIGKKISLGSKLLPAEVEVVKKVAQNRKLIEDGMKKLGQDASIRAGKEIAKKQLKKQAVVQGAKNLGKDAAVYSAAGVGHSKGYDIVRGGTPKVKTSVEGFDWDFVKSAFGSSGNKKDNELLNLAWDKGWRPDKPVPAEFQTDTYKNRPDNLKGLQDLLAGLK